MGVTATLLLSTGSGFLARLLVGGVWYRPFAQPLATGAGAAAAVRPAVTQQVSWVQLGGKIKLPDSAQHYIFMEE